MQGREGSLGSDENGAPNGRVAAGAPRGIFIDVDERDEREAHSRDDDSRETAEDREMSEDERLEMFCDSLQQSVLPDLPHIPGYHTCWLTRSNPRDSIQWRLRIGYKLIRLEEHPGWDPTRGQSSGYVEVNEMVAAKIPLGLYNRYMREVHDRMPLQEEGKLKAMTDHLKNEAAQLGAMVDEGDGTRDIVQRAKPMPEFLS